MHYDFLRLSEIAGDIPPPGEDWEWSGDIWLIRRGEWNALFRPLNLGLLYLRKDYLRNDTDLWRRIPEGIVYQLKRERFLVRRNSQTDTEERQRLVREASQGYFRFICLIPTNGCAMRCAYCHQYVSSNKAQTMSIEEAEKGLVKCASLCSQQDKPVDILIYGGEPLKAFDITSEVIRLTKGKERVFAGEVNLSFTTSGMGLTTEQAQLLAKNDVFIIVSLDGPPQVNDKTRFAGKGISSYKAAEKAFFTFKDAGCRTGLSVTIGKHNIDGFTESLEFLLQRFPLNDIGLNAWLHPQNAVSNPFQVSAEEAVEAFMEGWMIALDYGVYAEQPFRRLKPFVLRKPLLKDCSSPGERLLLVPGGKLGFCDSCYPKGEHFYSLNEFPERDSNEYQVWAGLSSVNMPDCSQCAAMTVCGGACRYDAYAASGKWDGIDTNRCKFELNVLGWMIWRLFDLLEDDSGWIIFPSDEERQKLFGKVKINSRNQPFTAGSYSEENNSRNFE